MKKTKLILSTIVFVLTALIFVQACKKSNNPDLSGTYELQVNQAKPIPTSESFTTITVISIDDTRCPINANCITAGSAIVKAKIIDRKGEQTIVACLGDCAETKIKQTIILNGIKYKYVLKDVTPFPVYPKVATAEQRAIIVFTKA